MATKSDPAVGAGPAIRIRMYRVGFGDCFLISFPAEAGKLHILVDCGVHSRGDIGTMQAAVNNIAEETGGKLALVVATHAHQDHISGFAAHEDVFRQFEVGEVWMPWTENPKDADAARLKQNHIALVQALAQHFAARPPSDQAKAALENLSGNDEALRLLKSGIHGGTVRYVEAGRQMDDVAGIKGLSARILGPPRDQKFLARMNPPADERFLRAAPDGGVEAVNGVLPFEDVWKVDASSNPYYAAIDERDKNLLAVAATNAEGLAFALDQIVNNTSVVTLFTFSGKHLLFPGDAQYGSWESWIEQQETKELLPEVSFYKVAHHGSLNATPKSALEGMTEKSFAAMVSTQSQPWASIPLPKLMEALEARASGAVRSDSIRVEGAPEGPVVLQLPEGFEQGAFWFDYSLPV